MQKLHSHGLENRHDGLYFKDRPESAAEPAQGTVDTQTQYRDRPSDDGKYGDLAAAVIAIFRSEEAATFASTHLDRWGVAINQVHRSGTCTITIDCSSDDSGRLIAAAKTAGALDAVMDEYSRNASWYSHQQGQVTGAGVEAGSAARSKDIAQGSNSYFAVVWPF